ncbi:MAG: CopG family transcriptional regulator, partial [Desulfurococcaceae archaeon]
FESTLPPRVDRDRLFASLERSGAVVIKLSRERVAISPEFWEFFKKKLDEIHTSDEREIQSIMGEKGFKLWKALYSDNLVIYDSKLRKWRPVHGELP